eukprot:jgi/Mesen1/7805/ME000408S06903
MHVWARVQELDFLNEASNAEACGANFRALSPRLRRSVAVPAMHRQLCSRRILTMEFMDGVSVTDVAAIKALGLRPADVAKLVSEAFGEMIFHHGFVHCDPHAANLLVRLEPSPSAGEWSSTSCKPVCFPAVSVQGANTVWLIDEVQESLPKVSDAGSQSKPELDFLNEASNAEACGANFRALSPRLRRSVAVPAMHRQLCSRRILTMEFMDGVSVTDVAAIKALGLRPADVAKLVSEAFGEMIFHHGFVHCDPHAANLLVRLEPSPSAGGGNGGSGSSKRRSKQAGRARPQLVLLDHGLYRTLPPAMRFNYASLWKALVFADVEHIKQHSAALGAGDDLFTIFAAVLTMRTWERVAHSSLDHLQAPDTPAERAELQLNAKRYAREITELLARLPRVVLLLLKTNDCLRAVDNALGAPINTFVITGRQCTHALAEIQRAEAPSIWSSMRADLQIWHAEFRIFQLQAIACLLSLRQRLLRWLYDRLPYETPAVHLS